MKNLFLIAFLFLNLSGIFAQNKVIHPKKGEIIFSSKAIYVDPAGFKKELENIRDKFFKAMIGTEIDSSILNQTKDLPFPDDFFSKDSYQFHYNYEDTVIRSYQTVNDTVSGDYTLINLKNFTYTMQAKFNKSIIYTTPKEIVYATNKDITIEEFRAQTKMIKGFKCFKVIYKYKYDIDDDEEDDDAFDEIFNAGYNTTELWVTESIQSMFHPVCQLKEILTKYYPLEIIEKSAVFKSIHTQFEVVAISLSN